MSSTSNENNNQQQGNQRAKGSAPTRKGPRSNNAQRTGNKSFNRSKGSFGERKGNGGNSSDGSAKKYQGKRFASSGERTYGNGRRKQEGDHAYGDGERKGNRRFNESEGRGNRRFDNDKRNNNRRFNDNQQRENRRFNDGKPYGKRPGGTSYRTDKTPANNEERESMDKRRSLDKKDGFKGNRGNNRTFNGDRGGNRDQRENKDFKRENSAQKKFEGHRFGNTEKRKVYKNKKEFDQEKVATLMDESTAAYRGELDPKREERSRIAPGRKTREMRELKEESERQKASEERKEREAIDDITVPAEKRFYKNEASPARLAALDVTRAVRKRNAYANEVIASRIDTSDMSTADRAFATLLVLGVVSTYGTLDEIINRAMKKPTDAFDDVRDALRISVYEIIFLDKSPHAALDQGVELVRAISPSASGLGNAILHRVLEMKPEFPFGDPNHDINALARVYAFPKWMARKLVEDMGAKEASTLMHASNEPAPLFISVNALKANDEEIIAAFEAEGATLRPAESQGVSPAGCFHVSNPRAIAAPSITKLFDEGKILVSDASAQTVAECIFDQDKPESVLEVGAGRGTKTILIQNAAVRTLGHQIVLTSVDLHDFKVQLLKERASSYGVELEQAVAGNAMRLENVVGDATYDTVFVDAPCSGLGTLRRHPEIRWRINEQHIEELADTQLAILRSAAKRVAAQGHLVYSTCTVTYDENTGVVKRFLESPEGKNFKLATVFDKSAFISMLCNGSPDAHFAVKFERVE